MAGRAKAQAFAHRLVEFADAGAARAFLEERGVDLDEPNGAGWSVLMSVCACGGALRSGHEWQGAKALEAIDCRAGRPRGLRARPHGQRGLRDGCEPLDGAAPGGHLAQCGEIGVVWWWEADLLTERCAVAAGDAGAACDGGEEGEA